MKATRIGRGSRIGLAVVLGVGLAAAAGGVLHVKGSPSSYDLCLQGDVNNPGSSLSPNQCVSGQVDWANFFDSSGNKLALPAGTAGTFTDSLFSPDFALPDPTTFATGSKDTLPVSGWQCSSAHNLGAKVDLANTYATVERLKSNGDTILDYGSEIQSANGDHNQGIWLLQDKTVGCSSATGTTTFSGSHVNGDLLFAVELTGGGSKPFSASVVAFEWQCTTASPAACSAASPGSLVALNGGASIGTVCPGAAADLACAITNETWNVQTPWAPHNTAATALGPQQFFEGGIDVTAILAKFGGTAECFSRFLTDTRSSQSSTATLFDYTQGDLKTCATPTVNTQLKQQSGTSQANTDSNVTTAGVTVGSKVYDTSTLSGSVLGTPSGSVTYKLFANNDCTVAVPSTAINGATLGSDGTIADVVSGPSTVTSTTMPNSSTLTFTSTGTYYWVAYYSGDGVNLAGHSGCAAEPLLINTAPTTLATTASNPTDPIIVGSTVTISDSATISGAFGTPGGTITFTLNGPATTTSCGALITTIGPVTVTSTTPSSGPYSFSPTAIGTYYWSAVWTGDSNNVGSSHAGCSVVNNLAVVDSLEAVPVVQATPTLSTTMALTDTVTVNGGDNPTGSVTFTLYANATCSGPDPGNGQTVQLINGTATTPNAISIPLNSTTYSWKVQYLGNTNNNTVTDGCTTLSHEQVTTSYAGQ
jgi:hypothetical protein